MHCFTGGPDEARESLARGAIVSFSGIITFPSGQDLRDAAAIVPLDRLLVETDSPYLAPVPHRGKRNQPAWVTHVGEAVSAAKGVTVDECAVCHSTLDPLTYPFSRYEGIGGESSGWARKGSGGGATRRTTS